MGSEMCIRDRLPTEWYSSEMDSVRLLESGREQNFHSFAITHFASCLLYTSDAADERSSVDLGGRRIIKKKNILSHEGSAMTMKSTQNRVKKRHTK
mgnify:CR=1 FL=1